MLKTFVCANCGTEVRRPTPPLSCQSCGQQRIGLFREKPAGGAPERDRSPRRMTCRGSVELARGAHLLQHEATYNRAHEDFAHARGHSTVEDAARVAREAEVHTLLAFHFSTRYDEPAIRDMVEARMRDDGGD